MAKLLTLNHNQFQDFELLTEEENNRVRSILKHSVQGNYSLSSLDKTQTYDRYREDIIIEDPNGNHWDLPQLMKSISYTDSINGYESARNAYTILFDMLTHMSGENLTKDGKLKPSLTFHENTVELPLYPKGSWIEYNKEIPITDELTQETTFTEGWEEVNSQPIKLQFNSKQDAEEFYNHILNNVLLLEPLVSSFEPQDSEIINTTTKFYNNGEVQDGPLRVLIDNEGSLSENGIITKNSSEFRYDIDNNANQTFFKTSHWQQISSYLKTKNY